MRKIEIYTTPICGFCMRAKALLDRKGVKYKEIDLFETPEARAEMMKRANGRRTVPQIFIDDQGIGGSDDLAALDSSGELDKLLRAI